MVLFRIFLSAGNCLATEVSITMEFQRLDLIQLPALHTPARGEKMDTDTERKWFKVDLSRGATEERLRALQDTLQDLVGPDVGETDDELEMGDYGSVSCTPDSEMCRFLGDLRHDNVPFVLFTFDADVAPNHVAVMFELRGGPRVDIGRHHVFTDTRAEDARTEANTRGYTIVDTRVRFGRRALEELKHDRGALEQIGDDRERVITKLEEFAKFLYSGVYVPHSCH